MYILYKDIFGWENIYNNNNFTIINQQLWVRHTSEPLEYHDQCQVVGTYLAYPLEALFQTIDVSYRIHVSF